MDAQTPCFQAASRENPSPLGEGLEVRAALAFINQVQGKKGYSWFSTTTPVTSSNSLITLCLSSSGKRAKPALISS